MRKIVAGLFVSLDGAAEAPDKWHFPYFNEEMEEAVGAQMAESDALLLGRVTFEEWEGYWPGKTGEDPAAEFINGMDKYVVTTTRESTEWENTTFLRGDLVERVTELKRRPGKNVLVSGGPTLVRSLLRHGLLDELRLLIHPIVVGSGQRLFQDGDQIPLKLTSSTVFTTGVLSLVYEPAEK